MSVAEELLGDTQSYAERFDEGDLPLPPARRIAVVACMDARLHPGQVSAPPAPAARSDFRRGRGGARR